MGRKSIKDSEEIITEIVELHRSGHSYRKIVTIINEKYKPKFPLTRYRVQKHIKNNTNNVVEHQEKVENVPTPLYNMDM